MSVAKLTLVFCCYNVSKYLDGIYNWLIAQPYKDIEVIFVEDCSTDNTKEKLISLIHDPRMRIIENEVNLGLSESRNVGLRNATGDYIGFPDPDDMFDSDWLCHIAEVIQVSQAKVIVTGMREDYENDDKLEYSKDILSKFSGEIQDDFIEALLDLEETMLFGYMNNKFYKREFLLEHSIFCKTMALKEDFDLNIRVFDKVSNYYILNKPFYFYKKRRDGNTLTSKYVPDYFDIHQGSVFMLKNLLENRGKLSNESESLLVNRFFRYFLSAIERNAGEKSGLTISQQTKWAKEICTDIKYRWFFERKERLSGKMRVLKPFLNSYSVIILVGIGYSLKIIKERFPILFVKVKQQ